MLYILIISPLCRNLDSCSRMGSNAQKPQGGGGAKNARGRPISLSSISPNQKKKQKSEEA